MKIRHYCTSSVRKTCKDDIPLLLLPLLLPLLVLIALLQLGSLLAHRGLGVPKINTIRV